MRYAIFVPADQTIMYLADGVHFTTKHPEARLFSSVEEAREAWNIVRLSEGNPDAPLVDSGPKADAGDHGGYLEIVPDEAEFRMREDTW